MQSNSNKPHELILTENEGCNNHFLVEILSTINSPKATHGPIPKANNKVPTPTVPPKYPPIETTDISKKAFLEISVVSIGGYLGGTVGVGTLLFAFGIGPCVAFGLFIVDKISTKK